MRIGFSIMFIILITLVLGAIIAAISCHLYKKHLARVVSGEERDIHSKTADPKSVFGVLLAVIICIWLITAMFSLSSLITRTNRQTQQLNNQYRQMEWSFRALEEKLDAQSDIAQNVYFEFGAINPEKRTISVDFEITLKKYREDSTVAISLGNEKTVLTGENGYFRGTLEANLFISYENYPVLTVTTDGVTESQILDECFGGCLADACLKMMGGEHFYEMKYDRKGKMNVTGTISLIRNEAKIKACGLKSTSVVMLAGDKTLKKIPVNFTGDVSDEIPLKSAFEIEKGTPFYLCIEYETDAGWTVRSKIAYYDWNEGYRVFMGNEISVTDENGTVIFAENE